MRKLVTPKQAGEPPPSEPATVTVARVLTLPHDADLVEEIARVSFPDPQFSLHEELARPWTRVWLARDAAQQGLPVGFLVAWHVADELHVLSVATSPAMRGRGIGTALFDVVVGYAAAHRVRLVLLEVRRSNRTAIRLYRRLGFTAMGLRPRYYTDNDEDAVEMVMTLDPLTGRVVPGRDEIRIDV